MDSSREASAPPRRRSTSVGLQVVALVASAGGFEPVKSILRGLGSDFPAAIVVAMHLPEQGSQLVKVLGRQIWLPVQWARPGDRIEAGHVAICPPRSVLEILPDRSFAVRRQRSPRLERPLDALLTSLADSFGNAALGVVLSGMGRDGAQGVRALREAGSIALTQTEATAEHASMPRAAAEAGADLVLPLREIAPAIGDVARGEPLRNRDARAIRATFGDAGAVAAFAREIDWSGHPLGPVDQWPAPLRGFLRHAMDSPNPTMVVWGEDYLWFLNNAAIPAAGAQRADGLGRPYGEVFPELWNEVAPLLTQAMTGEHVLLRAEPYTLERGGRLEQTWFDAAFTPIRGAQGTVDGVSLVFFERTDELLAARRLQTLNRLASLPTARSPREALADAVAVLGAAPDAPFAVAYLVDTLGTRATLVGAVGVEEGGAMAPRQLRAGRGAAWPVRDVVESGREVVLEDLAARFRGHVVGADRLAPERAVLHPVRNRATGSPIGLLVVGTDSRLRFGQPYREFLSVVGETVSGKVADSHARRRERERVEQLAQVDRSKTEFFSNVSHEFRTPLTLMLSPLEELLGEEDAFAPPLRDDLELIRRNAARLLRLVETLLDFSQLEAGRLQPRFVSVDLAERTREIASQFGSAAARAGLKLRMDLQPLDEPVWVDEEMWEKIVSNLLANALKFTFEGEVEVTLRARQLHAELTVSDTGGGIPEDELPHVFERFHRVRGTRARTQAGTGIGLALVDELVRLHNGRTRVNSALGAGTTFTVWIPFGPRASELETREDGKPVASGIAAAMAEDALRWDVEADSELERSTVEPDDSQGLRQELRRYAPGAHVLVVDDNAELRDYLTRLLGDRWNIETARDGQEALELARRAPPDLVVADVMMPRLDGFGLVAELRNDPALSATPVVLLTARAGEETAIEGLLAGAADYIVKPFSARELVARVGGQLELARARRHAAELNAFRIGLSDALRALSDPLEIQRTACRALVEQLGADRARFVEVDEAGAELITMGGYAVDGMPGGFGHYALDDYAPLAHAILAGRRLAIDDTQSDPYVGEIHDALAELEIGAQIVLPLIRGEGSTVALAVHQRTPRRWSDEDIAIAEEAAGRAWAEVERTRAEQALRASEERNEFLVRFSDAVRGIAEPQLVAKTACRMLAEQLAVDRAHWAEIDWTTHEYVVQGAFHVPTVSPISGRYPLDAWEPFTSGHLAGRTTIADDVTAAAQIPDAVRHRLGELDVGARVVVPVVVDGTLCAALAVNHRSPRRWSDAEVTLVEAVAARAWAEVERARAEAALRGSEERMRLAIGTTGMVTWEWLPAADRITTSDSFAAVYGLAALSGAQDGFALVLAEDRERHLEKVARIAAEGGSYNSEFRIRRPDDGRIVWLEERAEAQVDDEGSVERVVGVTLDISERKHSEVALRENEARLAGLSEAFQAAVKGATLEESLGVLVRTCVEQQGGDARAAFYLADHDRLELRHIVGMPDTYAECIDGFRIGPESLACGLATWTRRPVITPDVNEAPEWEPWRWLAAEHAYRGVWSFPIETTEGKVVGTLALYLASPRAPTARDLELADVITRAAAIIISRAQEAEQRQRAEKRSRETEARLADHDRLRSMANIRGVGVLTWEPASGTLIDANDAFLEMSGYTRQQVSSGQITQRSLTPEVHLAESERQMERLARTGRIGPYEKDLIHADGSRSRMLCAGASMSDRTAVEYCIDLRQGNARSSSSS